jgi:hypothetical protein
MQPNVDILSLYNILRSQHWRYEAVRITAVIVATAIMKQSSLSMVLGKQPMSIEEEESFPSLSASPSLLKAYMTSGSDKEFYQPVASGGSTSVDSTSISAYSNPSFINTLSTMSSPISEIVPRSPLRVERPLRANEQSHGSSNSSVAVRRSVNTAERIPNISISLLHSLKEALENSDLSDCWGDMSGVLLWIGLTAGAASRHVDDIVLKRYFSAMVVRVVLMLSFEHPEPLHATMLRMTELIENLRRQSG